MVAFLKKIFSKKTEGKAVLKPSKPAKHKQKEKPAILLNLTPTKTEQNKLKSLFKKDSERIEAYKQLIINGKDAINDSYLDIKEGVGNNSIPECLNQVLKNYYSYNILRLASADSLIALVLKTIANEASRTMPSVEIFFNDEKRNEESKDFLINLRQELDTRLADENILLKLKRYVKCSKIFGAVFILKYPMFETNKNYWLRPFNLDTMTLNKSIDFKLIDPEDYSAYFGYVDDVAVHAADSIYSQPEYWQVNINGINRIIHKSHIIRVVEEPVTREELFRRKHCGLSLVAALLPLSNTLHRLEALRVHLMQLKGTVMLKFPNQLLEKAARAAPLPFSYTGDTAPNEVVLSNLLNDYGDLMDTSRERNNLIGLIEGQELANMQVLLDGIKENIESYYSRFAALASVPVSVLGLTPPRGLNDSGAVEADGSRRAVEANQNTILRPIVKEMVKIYLQDAINKLGYRDKVLVDDLQITINFKPANAVTALDESTIIKNDVDAAKALMDAGALSRQDAVLYLQKRHPSLFDHIGLGELGENGEEDEETEELFKQFQKELAKDEEER